MQQSQKIFLQQQFLLNSHKAQKPFSAFFDGDKSRSSPTFGRTSTSPGTVSPQQEFSPNQLHLMLLNSLAALKAPESMLRWQQQLMLSQQKDTESNEMQAGNKVEPIELMGVKKTEDEDEEEDVEVEDDVYF